MRKTLLAVAIAVAGATTVVPAASAAPATLDWGPCPAGAFPTPDLQCTTMKVPLDYRDPGGRTIDIAVSRLPSKNPAKRRGVLLTNPGGPGGGGLDYPQLLKLVRMPQDVLDSYDIIGFDPRGVAHSTPVTCDLKPEQIAVGNLPYANGPADVVKQAALAKQEAKQCAEAKTGSLLPYVTTANTARDMDRIRAALGEAKVSYLGASYGTYLGAVYTTLFPERSDRFVLDSSLGPGGYDIDAMHGFARGMEDRFPDFAKFAAAHPEYGLGTTPARVTAKFHELAARLDRAPVEGVDGSVFRGLTFEGLYSTDLAPLAVNWQALDQGRPPAPPVEPVTGVENLLASRFAVICGDSAWPRSIASYQVDVAVARVRYPLIGAGAANIAACAYWAPPAEPRVRITGHGPANVLMVQNQRDPGTPLSGARKLRAAFGERARMITIDQGGHGAYLFTPSKCGNSLVTAFLVSGQRPADTFCAAGS
ncbi:pimeloyl-ACP methyl ester carboxylesterase [Amycolatopsis lexingtonensis]|uniref:Pimeloyl-ACP methyl ester carboxylesterase n=1 Tax=Amycolatopsis lexingtonensis TaxID=218822 RepID=A0ABR9I4S4_9PSEU|nr:alpha/beta hydrolase [Amycolatopsis lexingtonensis]MBE1498192.1 pimeloyl-ACP methyl ester carboxylesterase [Amycolatopsis lexingtonensis]